VMRESCKGEEGKKRKGSKCESKPVGKVRQNNRGFHS